MPRNTENYSQSKAIINRNCLKVVWYHSHHFIQTNFFYANKSQKKVPFKSVEEAHVMFGKKMGKLLNEFLFKFLLSSVAFFLSTLCAHSDHYAKINHFINSWKFCSV